MNATFETFGTWSELVDCVRGEYKLFYQAPMDYKPHLVTATIRKDGKLRVYPCLSDADPFTADVAHLERFRRLPSGRTAR
jgi:hypothetical protein